MAIGQRLIIESDRAIISRQDNPVGGCADYNTVCQNCPATCLELVPETLVDLPFLAVFLHSQKREVVQCIESCIIGKQWMRYNIRHPWTLATYTNELFDNRPGAQLACPWTRWSQ